LGEARGALGEAFASTNINELVLVKPADGELYKMTSARKSTSGFRVAGIWASGETTLTEGSYITVIKQEALLKNSGSNALTNAHIGTVCYAEDGETVCSTGATIRAGTVMEVTADGVWVKVGIDEQITVSS
jgi:hypothetical protein